VVVARPIVCDILFGSLSSYFMEFYSHMAPETLPSGYGVEPVNALEIPNQEPTIEFSLKEGVNPADAQLALRGVQETFFAPMPKGQYELLLNGQTKQEGPLGKFMGLFEDGEELLAAARAESFDTAETMKQAGFDVGEQAAIRGGLQCAVTELMSKVSGTERDELYDFKVQLRQSEKAIINQWLETEGKKQGLTASDIQLADALLRKFKLTGALSTILATAVACSGGGGEYMPPTEIATQVAGESPVVEVTQAQVTQEAPDVATETQEAQEALPSRWDDPEVLASIRSDFEAKFGMSIEDYYQKALDEDRVSEGHSTSAFQEGIYYVSSAMNGIGLGTRIVETDSGVKQLVTYVFRNGGVYGINVAFEGKEGFVQTSIDSIGYTTSQNSYAYENPLSFSSLEETKEYLDKAAVGNMIDFALLVRFRDVDTCSEPQGQYIGNVPEKYWQYIGNLCRTPGNYINTESQETITTTPGGVMEIAWNSDIEHMVEQGAPDGGLIATMVGIATLP